MAKEDEDLKGYKKLTEIRLLNHVGGESVNKKHLVGGSLFLVNDLERKGIDYKIKPSNHLKNFKIYLSSADLFIRKEQVYK